MVTQETDLQQIQSIAQRIVESDVPPKPSGPRIVNADEVINEIIPVKVLHFSEADVTDDEGYVIIDPTTGKAYKTRSAKTRTAKIQNIVPLPIYNQVVAARDMLSDDGPMEAKFELMQDLVWKVWSISEQWFTKEMFNECVDAGKVIELFQRFFNESRLNRIKV
jgi:hypothetical protein